MIEKEEAGRSKSSVLAAAYFDYQKKLNTHAFFKIHDKAMSDDLVQDTFMKTWAYLVRGGKIDVMKAFLYHVLNNLIVDQYRKKKTSSLDILLEKGFEPGADESSSVSDFLDGKEALAMIKSLPKKYSGVMHMKHVQDFTLEEISDATHQTKNTVAVQLHRGFLKLKSVYDAKQKPVRAKKTVKK